MNNIILLPQAQRVNNIEDAVILDDFKAKNHFIEANTQEVTFEHLKNDCITPVFAKDNKLTINHADFIETIEDATRTFFHGQKVGTPNIRVSHVIKGRIPEAVRKPASQLLDSDKTIYYERAALELFNSFNPARQLQRLHSLGNTTMNEHQFCQILGKMRLYQCLPNYYQRNIPKMLLTDTQINSVAKAYINDENFNSFGEDINMWKFYNLLTGANKSSYIDSFLDRSLNTTQLALGINAALHGDERYKWFID